MKLINKTVPLLAVAILSLTMAGCYNASVVTDATPSNQTIEKKWASGFLFGLVPPSTVETASQCQSGVARVETKLSFLNMVASQLTLGLYAPMSIVVTCAQPGSAMLDTDVVIVPTDSDSETVQESMQRAAAQSVETGEPAAIRFE